MVHGFAVRRGAICRAPGAAGAPPERIIANFAKLLGKGPAITSGANLKRRDDNGNSILTGAAHMCGPNVVAHLIASGAEVNVTSKSGIEPAGARATI
jgi:hypothetical protein